MKAPTVRDLPTTTSRRTVDGTAVWIVVLVVAAFLGTWAGTQYVAHRLDYHDNLGPILYRLPPDLEGLVSGAALACIVGAMALMTRAHFRRYSTLLALGATALFVVRLGPIYGPFRLLRSARAYHGMPELAATITDAVRVAALIGTVSIFAGVTLVTSTVLVHTKGFGSSFQCDAHTSIAAPACANAAGGPTLCHRSQWTSSRTRSDRSTAHSIA